MNILLDSKEHVKIGDFGLATRQFFSKIAKKGGDEGVAKGGEKRGDKSNDLTMVSRLNVDKQKKVEGELGGCEIHYCVIFD